MIIQDLQDTLRRHADAVEDTGLVGRSAAARRRGATIRRRRRLGALAVAAAFVVAGLTGLAGLAGVADNPFDRVTPVVAQPDPSRAPSPSASPEPFPQSFAGRTLIDSKVITGEAEIVLTEPVSRNTEWRAICRGAGIVYLLHMSLDGGAPSELPCDVAVLSGRSDSYRLGPEAAATGGHTLRVWLTRRADGATAAPPQGLLGAAVYRLPEPVATVAGHAVQALEADEDRDFRMTSHSQSQAGDRAFAATYPAADVPVLVDWYTLGSGSRSVQVTIDGQPETVVELGSGGPGLILAPGRSHTVELRVLDKAPPDTLLGLVWREQVR